MHGVGWVMVLQLKRCPGDTSCPECLSGHPMVWMVAVTARMEAKNSSESGTPHNMVLCPVLCAAGYARSILLKQKRCSLLWLPQLGSLFLVSCPSLLLSASLLSGPIPLEVGCRYLLECWVQAALRVDIFLAERPGSLQLRLIIM